MSINFTATQYLENAASPFSTYPCTMGAWVMPAASGTGEFMFFSVGQNTTRNAMSVGRSAANWEINADNGTSFQNTTAAGLVANQWAFILARWISSTNRRLAVLNSDGSMPESQGVTNVTISGLTRVRVGNRADNFASPVQPWSGMVGEFWYTNTDIIPDGGALPTHFLPTLAKLGPFGFPNIWPSIIEYHSFRSSMGSDNELGGETYAGPNGRMTWAQSGAPIIGAHPPLASSYLTRSDIVGQLSYG